MKIFFKWEEVSSPCEGDYTERAKVIGGWIFRTILRSDNSESVSTIFIPDISHSWEVTDISDSILDSPINTLNLSVRTINCMTAIDIITVRDLLKRSQVELLMAPNMGKKGLNEIISEVNSHGLKLRDHNEKRK